MIQYRWLAVLGFFVLSAGASAQSLQFDSDVSDELKKQVLDDLAFIGSVEGPRATPLHQAIFGAVHGDGYSQWFASRVFYFGVDGCGDPNAVACVKASDANKMFVTDAYIHGSAPQVGRVMTLFHEARHTETDNGMWPHAQCPWNFPYRSIWTGARLENKPACDSSEYGSYASASILLDNLAKFCLNCTEKVRADAHLYADDQVKRVIGDAAGRIQADFADSSH